MSAFIDYDRKNLETVKQQASKIVEEVSMESFFNFSDFTKIAARLSTMIGSLKRSIGDIFKRKEITQITGRDKANLKIVSDFISDKKFDSLLNANIDLTKTVVYVPRHLNGKIAPLINTFKEFFSIFPAKLLEELKEANKAVGLVINEPDQRTSTRVKDMISPALNGQTETFLKLFSELYDVRKVEDQKEFFDAYDSLKQFKEVGLVIEEIFPPAFDKTSVLILEELDAFADGMIIFSNIVKAGTEGSVSPEVLKQSALACDKFVEAAELYSLSLYRLKEFLVAYADTCEEKIKKVK